VARGITHIVSAAVSDGVGALFSDAFIYELVDLPDDSAAPLLPCLARTSSFISAALGAGGSVFVHCKVGTSRSVSLVLYFLMEHKGMSLREALLHVMAQRSANPKAPYTHPNRGFMKTLIGEEARLRVGAPPSLSLQAYYDCYSTGRNFSPAEAASADL
jgi:hypothetical protein